jgi:hypothetical protein
MNRFQKTAFPCLTFAFVIMQHALGLKVTESGTAAPDGFSLLYEQKPAAIVADPADYPVVGLAAGLFADDVQRVTGVRPTVSGSAVAGPIIIVGTLGHSGIIDKLAAAGKLGDLDKIKNQWETTMMKVIANPLPGVKRALVIVGSDRRGAAYGLMKLSAAIGVSPWYWWADVPPQHHKSLNVALNGTEIDAPGVKYRGIFINDEDWGINPWASKTFDPQFKNIGPKTYEKVFELMLRLRLNYIWPAMHACSAEFGATPENAALADKYGIVAGASHCEPMLYNNVHWKAKEQGPWNYSLNRDAIHSVWEQDAKDRGNYEAVWTLGIRGIHDAKMESPPDDMPGKINLLTQVIGDQQALVNQYVTKQWGPTAECFVPYKEVQLVYDAGLKVPPEVTLIWADDNFGYIRRLSSPGERTRPGGGGVYWHISYFGAPHSYTWIDTTAPGLMWEELHKAWENDARTIWVINVGDIKPGEIGIDYFSRLAWNPDGLGPDSQRNFLHDFVKENFGEEYAQPIADMLADYYRLGTVRKPELMNREWALSLPQVDADTLTQDYTKLLQQEASFEKTIPAVARDAFFETIGFPAKVLAETGLIFMADRRAQWGAPVAGSQVDWRAQLGGEVTKYNTQIAGGKWNLMMPGMETSTAFHAAWATQVMWPWDEKPGAPATPPAIPPALNWRMAAKYDPLGDNGAAKWTVVNGLGPSGCAVALEPARQDLAWNIGDKAAPQLRYTFQSKGGNAQAYIDFLPTFRLYPGRLLRVGVSIDDGPAIAVEVPGSSGSEDERGAVRSNGVQDNYVRASVPLPALSAGKHTLTISAIDPGAVIDQVALP